MPRYSQAGHALSIVTPLGDDGLLLERLAGTEGISQLFHFQLDVLSEEEVDFSKLLGGKAVVTLAIPGQPKRWFHGIIRRFSEGVWIAGPKGPETFLRCSAELVPELWLLTRRVQSRVFQNRTVPEILGKILRDEWQQNIDLQGLGTYPARNYCVQYQESDLAFVSRLMEEEGIAYFFDHREEDVTLRLVDQPAQFPPISASAERTGGTLPDVIVLEPKGRRPCIWAWDKSQQLLATKYTTRDYFFEAPSSNLTSATAVAATVDLAGRTFQLTYPPLTAKADLLEQFDYPANFAHRFDQIQPGGAPGPDVVSTVTDTSTMTSKLRMQQETTQALTAQGVGNCSHFLPGFKFTLQRRGREEGTFLLEHIEQSASIEGAYTSGEKVDLAYENRFRCIPAAVPYRPQRVTPRPRIDGFQTATVEAPGDAEIFVDSFGRIKVRFHWDRDTAKGQMHSCWIRVAQIWAGKNWGAFFWPRVGHEVVVAFEEGNPDRPVVIGSVYNGANPPPLNLPQNAMLAGFKSCIVGGDPTTQFNAVIFWDAPGTEFVQIHSEKDGISNSESNSVQFVPNAHVSFHGSL